VLLACSYILGSAMAAAAVFVVVGRGLCLRHLFFSCIRLGRTAAGRGAAGSATFCVGDCASGGDRVVGGIGFADAR